MKKILIASTAMMLLAGAASADVTLSGSGYFGLNYDKDGVSTDTDPTAPDFGKSIKTTVLSRLQLDIAFSSTTDTGLTFFGSYRIRDGQSDPGVTGGVPNVNGGLIGVSSGGLSLSVGNATDAVDAMSTYYDSEIGICGCGGETLSIPFATSQSTGAGFDGILATYTTGGLIARISYLQTNGNGAGHGQTGVSFDYKTGNLSVGLGYTSGTGYNGTVFVAEYALGAYNLGFAAGDNSIDGGDDNGMIYTLYGSTTFGATKVQAFVSSASDLMTGETEKTTFGIGGSYDLGSGAAIVGHVRTSRTKDTLGDLGVTFKF